MKSSMFLAAALAATAVGATQARGRRHLRETDLHYGFDDWKSNYNSRAHRVFTQGEDHFHRRLFEHESALPHDQLQTYVVKMHPSELGVTPELTASLELRASATIHTVVGADLMMHGTREHADAMREQPEVHKVVPYLPELKVTPHFEQLLPKPHELHRLPSRNLTELVIRLIPRERHEHLRKPAAELLPAFRAALAKACEAEDAPAEWRACRACAATDEAGRPRMEAEGDRTIVVSRVVQPDSIHLAAVLAHVPEVLWVEPKPVFHKYNADAAAITQSGSTPAGGGTPVGTKPIHDMGLHGEDEIIGVGDSGLDTGHCFFEDKTGGTAAAQTYGPAHRKVKAYRAYADGAATGTRDHGTHVVGSILGESSTPAADGATEKGVAYKAQVSFTDIGPADSEGLAVPNDLVTNFFNIDYDNGARLHSNSWGANVNAYTIPTSDVDEFMHQFDDMLILYAAGNSGGDGPASIGAPATCKNCLTVGASENNEPAANRQDGNVALFSSQGPSLGRNKPDVVAPGFMISSSNSNSPGDCPITEMAGTSMATPVTTGNTALVRQYFREGWFPVGEKGKGTVMTPSGALLKALMINSGNKLTGTYQGNALSPIIPNDIQGYGRIQLNKILFGPAAANGGKSPGDRLFVVDDGSKTLAAGQEHTYDINIAAGPDPVLGSEVKVTLVWTDPAAQPQAAAPLINNLDLQVISGGQTLTGNNKVDTTSNVEQVVIASGTAGPLQIKVKGTAVPQGPQKYALVVSGPLQVTSPPPASPAPPPPKPPTSPFGDSVAFGVTGPLLAIAVGASAFFMCKKSGTAAAGGGGGGGGAAASGPLPAGWKAMVDPNSGAAYYLHDATGKTQWSRPTEAEAPTTVAAPASGGVPEGWEEMTDAATQRKYYYNKTTGESQWTMPGK
jgi:hypothetical protein